MIAGGEVMQVFDSANFGVDEFGVPGPNPVHHPVDLVDQNEFRSRTLVTTDALQHVRLPGTNDWMSN